MQSYLLLLYKWNKTDEQGKKRETETQEKITIFFFIYLSCLLLPSTYVMLKLVHMNLKHQLLD